MLRGWPVTNLCFNWHHFQPIISRSELKNLFSGCINVQCTYNRSCRLLVKLNTLKGGLECSKTNILKVSLIEHSKEQFFHIFLRKILDTVLSGLFIPSIPYYCRSMVGFHENVITNHCVCLISVSHTDENINFHTFHLYLTLPLFHSRGITTAVHPSPLASLTQGSPS